MADKSDARYVSLPYAFASGSGDDAKNEYGSMTARVGLFKALFKDGEDLAAGCNSTPRTVSVSGHPRERVIGKGSKTIAQHTYAVEIFPRKNVSFGKGGEEYKVLLDGKWWGFRVSGKQSTFHAFLCTNREKLLSDMYYKTQHGANYYVNKKDPT